MRRLTTEKSNIRLQISVLFLFYVASVNAAEKIDGTLFLFCNEITDPGYLHLIFKIDEEGWLYDVINSKMFRRENYGSLPYALQTLSSDVVNNPFYIQSWVHRNGQDFTLLTASNFSREFRLDMDEKKFYEIDSGVESKSLSGTCVEMRIPEIAAITDKIEREFHRWAVMQWRRVFITILRVNPFFKIHLAIRLVALGVEGNLGLIGILESLCKRLRFDPVAWPFASWDRRRAVTAFQALEMA